MRVWSGGLGFVGCLMVLFFEHVWQSVLFVALPYTMLWHYLLKC